MIKRTLLLAAACTLALGGCSYMPSWMGGHKEDKPKLPGERISVLPVGSGLQADDGLKGYPVKLPAAAINPDWAQHTGAVKSSNGNLGLVGKLDSVINATIGSGEAFERPLIPRPVVAGGMVFAMDAVGTISAHDAANIATIRWNSKGVSETDTPPILGGGLAYDQGRLYVLSGRGMVAAFDAASGKELWHKTMRLPFRSAPRIADGKLFALTLDNQLYALNTANGEIVWSHRGISETAGLLNSVSPAISGDTLIVPYSSGEVYALALADGKEVWSDSLSPSKRTEASSLFAGIGGDPVVDDTAIFTVSSGGTMTAFSTNAGQHLWEKPVGAMNTPWVAGDFLFLLTTDNTLISMVKYDGRIRWATRLASYEDAEQKKRPITWKGPVLVGGNLAVVSSNGQLQLLSASEGKVVSTQAVPEDIETAPVVAGGRMYLVSKDAILHEVQ
jgi:outer membrane protein assembly factor BamB